MFELIKAEPVRIVAAVQATLAAAVLFGAPLSEAQLAGLVIAIAAWLSVVTRNKVEVT